MRTTDATAFVMTGLLLWTVPCIASSEPGGGPPLPGLDTIAGDEPQSKRLRFRGVGPTCMCLGGLSEEEIAAAQRKRTQAAADKKHR